MRTYLKTLKRMFKKHAVRFISIIFIVTVSVGLISGIGSSAEKIEASLTDFYKARNISDFVVKSTAGGFTDEQVQTMRDEYGEDNVCDGASLDVKFSVKGQEALVRLYFLDFAHWTVNLPEVVAGKRPEDLSDNEIACVAKTDGLKGLSTGEAVTLDFKEIIKQSAAQGGQTLDPTVEALLGGLPPVQTTVESVVHSPIAFAKKGEPAYVQAADAGKVVTVNDLDKLTKLDYIFYVSKAAIPRVGGAPVLGTLDLFVALPDRTVYNAFSGRYEALIEREREAIGERLGACAFITLYDNFSFTTMYGSADTIYSINAVLLVAFVLVAALVVSSTMTRLLEEERGQIACLRSLGYSGPKILFKYLLFATFAAGIAGVVSYLLGLGLASFIYLACGYSFVLPPMSKSIAMLYFLLTFFAVVVATVVATVIAGARMMRKKPAALLRPRPPRSGKKVFLEKITFIWKRLSFKYKSTLRNVLRYKTRFFMTVVSVACSMGLVIAGLALLDLCLFHNMRSTTITWLAVVIVVFAGLLTMAVIYTLTNINVSERTREIATLMVLGYYDREVTGYIYREVFINTVIGVLFGYPVGALLLFAVFTMMNFGSLGGVSWFMWLIAPAVVFLFTWFVTLLLRRRILKIDMNESLKAVE